MVGINLINEQDAMEYIDGFEGTVIERVLEAMQISGEHFKEQARLTKQFKDQTGHLKASIGYIVALDGDVTFDGCDNDQGGAEARELAYTVLKDYKVGPVLIGVAGKEYGIYVEARGLAVISQALPSTERMLTSLIESLEE